MLVSWVSLSRQMHEWSERIRAKVEHEGYPQQRRVNQMLLLRRVQQFRVACRARDAQARNQDADWHGASLVPDPQDGDDDHSGVVRVPVPVSPLTCYQFRCVSRRQHCREPPARTSC